MNAAAEDVTDVKEHLLWGRSEFLQKDQWVSLEQMGRQKDLQMGLKERMVEGIVLDEEQAGCFLGRLRQVQDDVELPPRKKCPVEKHDH